MNIQTIKQFRAMNETVCEKKYDIELDEGWYLTTAEALAHWSKENGLQEEQETSAEEVGGIDTPEVTHGFDEPKRRGRPPKAKD